MRDEAKTRPLLRTRGRGEAVCVCMCVRALYTCHENLEIFFVLSYSVKINIQFYYLLNIYNVFFTVYKGEGNEIRNFDP